ncbi:MAG: DUF5723 family protein [Syntrophothermus sp.]
MKLKIYLFFIGILVLPFTLAAQNELTLYQMNRLPQRMNVNPAFMPDHSYMGIPFLSNLKFSQTQPFRYNQVITKREDDTLVVKTQNFLDAMEKNSRVHNTFSWAIFEFGLPVASGKYYLHFGLKQILSQDVYLPYDLMNMVWHGNGSPEYLGKTTYFNTRVGGSAYDEWSAGFSGKFLNDKLAVGITAKYLSGRFNIKTKKADFSFYTSPDFYDIYISSDLEIQTTGIDNAENYFDQPTMSIIFPGNRGLAADLGASYQISNKFGISASVTDLGFIRWRKQTMTYVSKEPGQQFVYKGMTIGDFADMFTDFSSFGKNITDSIINLVEVDSIEGEKYTSGIPVGYNLAGNYRINDRSSATLLLHGMSCNHHFYPALSAGYSINATSWFGLNVTYNLYNYQYYNVGLGLRLGGKGFQFYVVTDNLPGIIFPRGTNNYGVQFGLNVGL